MLRPVAMRLARAWAKSAARHGLANARSPLLRRRVMATLCLGIPLFVDDRRRDDALSAAATALRALATAADAVYRHTDVDGANPVEFLLDGGHVEGAVVAVLRRGASLARYREALAPGRGDDDADDAEEARRMAADVQVRRELLELVWTVSTAAGVFCCAGLSPRIVGPLAATLRSDHGLSLIHI